ncbi:MAG TPA: hypothetical protein P5186_22630 [Candidatus Paceibacterota bacterium]|nr:hypothetical protein [Verrucomicrobiota bacterium]HRY50856.1 hypothetical protein [Candidatus Paceibacterota bacterium]HSA02942.1 hypothetical protein [Candidatus Paceibacterota bacterium]
MSFVADTPGLYHLLASAGDFTQEIRVVDNRAVVSVLGVTCNHLMIRHLDPAHVEISWPQEAEGYVLQEKSLGDEGSAWQDSGNVPLLQGARYSVVGDCQSVSRGYRLMHP